MTAPPRLSEAQWQQRVTDYADVRGWLWAHFRPAQTSKGWRTPVSGPLGVGFPDLLLLRDDRLVVLENKSDTGRATPAQRAALDAFAQVRRVDALLARPSDWDHIREVLA